MKLVASIAVFIPKKEGSMTNQDDEEKRNMRIMWIASGVVVLFIVGLMGLSMLGMLGNPSTSPTDMSSQSRTAPTQ
jgi:ABC-type Fe3+-siderophore transport system permease subunit